MSAIERVPTKLEMVTAELDRIWGESQRLTPAAVVEAARPVNAPLHEAFEWDDAAAGDAYRLIQAAALIRLVKLSVTVVDAGAAPETFRVRRWLAARDARPYAPVNDGYFPVEAPGSELGQQIALRQFQRDARAFEARWSHLAAFWHQVEEWRQTGT